MTAFRIVAISAGLSQPSSTRLLADRLTEASSTLLADAGHEVDIEIIELREHAQQITNTMLTGFAQPALADVIDRVAAADGVIAVTPIFNASYSGLFKSFFDVLDADADVLRDKPVLLGATGGTARHSLALEFAVRPLFAYLHASVVGTSVFASSVDWGSNGDTAGELMLRVGRAAREFADALLRSTGSGAVAAPDAVQARAAAEPDLRGRTGSASPDFVVVPFEQQLARLGVAGVNRPTK